MTKPQKTRPKGKYKIDKIIAQATFRICDWFDTTSAEKHKYGIQVKLKGYDCRWRHCSSDGKPMLFATAEQRDVQLKSLRKQSREETMCLKLEKSGLVATFHK